MRELLAKLRKHEGNWFDSFIMGVIVFSAIALGLETDQSLYFKYRPIFDAVDLAIIWIFIFEAALKIVAQGKRPWRYFMNSWNLFDFSIILVSVLPYFIVESGADYHALIATRVFRLFRSFRVFRAIRIVTHLKPLQSLVEALLKSIPKIGYVLALLGLLMYVYAIIGVFVFGHNDPVHFGSLSKALLSLFQCITGEAWPDMLKTQMFGSDVYGYDVFNHIERRSEAHPIIAPIYFISFILIGAMIILNLFIGVIVSELETVKTEERKGLKKLFNRRHTLILGWSQKVVPIVKELIIANMSMPRHSILILADLEKEIVERRVNNSIEEFYSTRVYVRAGSPHNTNDLSIVNPEEAKSIIVLPNKNEGFDDYYVIETLMSLANTVDKEKLDSINVCAIFQREENLRLSGKLFSRGAAFFTHDALVSSISALTLIQPGLTKALDETLGFCGAEIYIVNKGKHAGATFWQTLFSYKESTPLGLYRNGKAIVNPSPDEIVRDDDYIILLAEDDSKSNPSKPAGIKPPERVERYPFKKRPARILILGWNYRGALILEQANKFLGGGSRVEIVAPESCGEIDLGKLPKELSIKLRRAEIIDPPTYENLDFDNCDHILILNSFSGKIDSGKSDAVSLIAFSMLKDIFNRRNIKIPIMTEILHIQNRNLAGGAESDDFVVGAELASKILSQLSEDARLKSVFDKLLINFDNLLRIVPARKIDCESVQTWNDAVDKAARRGLLAIGYRQDGEMRLNPPRREKVNLADAKLVAVS